jgi:hypothetical protein
MNTWDYHITDNAEVWHASIEDEAGRKIADVYGQQGDYDTLESRAKLMAASPQLLDACIELSGLIQVLRGDNALADSQAEILIRASSAIAKAMFNFANPNAGAAQAYPAGRWTGGAK